MMRLSKQVSTTNVDKGVVPDNPSYNITIKDVTFAYPARPDIMVRRMMVEVVLYHHRPSEQKNALSFFIILYI